MLSTISFKKEIFFVHHVLQVIVLLQQQQQLLLKKPPLLEPKKRKRRTMMMKKKLKRKRKRVAKVRNRRVKRKLERSPQVAWRRRILVLSWPDLLMLGTQHPHLRQLLEPTVPGMLLFRQGRYRNFRPNHSPAMSMLLLKIKKMNLILILICTFNYIDLFTKYIFIFCLFMSS